jgi:hypothetical protein
MIPTQKYKKFLSDLIRRHMLILGPNIARDVASQVEGLLVDSSGEVSDLTGDQLLVAKDLISGYMNLSAPVTQLIAYQLFEQYPDIRAEYNEPITEINLTCSLTEQEASQPK